MISEVSFSVQFRVMPKVLEIEYSVINRSKSEIYLVDLAAQLQPKGITIRPATIEVTLDSKAEQELILSSKLQPMSANVLYPVAPDVYTSMLKPSEVKKSMFSVPLPIKLGGDKPDVKPPPSPSSIIRDMIKSQQPAQDKAPEPAAQKELNITKVVFILGVIPKAAGLKIEEQTIDNVVVSRMEATEAIHHQEELKVDSLVSPSIQLLM
jgi:hypothetical protein